MLDLGGGAGELSAHLNGQGIDCVSLDIWKIPHKEGARQVESDMHRMFFKNGSFDIVHSRVALDPSVFQQDYAELLQEVARVLKTN